MSLNEVSAVSIIKKQYFFKLKAYSRVFSSLIVIQIIGMFFSAMPSSNFGASYGNHLRIEGDYYSGDAVIILTILWAFTTAIVITTKAYRYDDFSFVTNRFTSHAANILFLLTASVLGGIFAILSGFVIKDIIFLTSSSHFIVNTRFAEHPYIFIAGIMGTILYLLLFSAIGYFVGILVQLHKLFIIIIPGLFVGLAFLGIGDPLINRAAEQFFNENSLFLLILKTVIFVGLLLAVSIGISNRLEVRR
ncbi:MAG: hypothetical protein ACO1OC_01120 [Tuberibacillus sp.]